MEFDINKYENVVFHKDDMTNKKIKAMLLWYEYRVLELNLGKEDKIKLLDNIAKMMASNEWYEVATFFHKKKLEINK